MEAVYEMVSNFCLVHGELPAPTAGVGFNKVELTEAQAVTGAPVLHIKQEC